MEGGWTLLSDFTASQVAYGSKHSVAFDLGARWRFLDITLRDTLLECEPDDKFLLRVRLEALFNVILRSHKSFPSQVDRERVKLAREAYRACRPIVDDWIGAKDHLGIRDEVLSDHAAKNQNYAKGHACAEEGKLYSRSSDIIQACPFDLHEILNGRWYLPIDSTLSDLGGVEIKPWHSAGLGFATLWLYLRWLKKPDARFAGFIVSTIEAINDVLKCLALEKEVQEMRGIQPGDELAKRIESCFEGLRNEISTKLDLSWLTTSPPTIGKPFLHIQVTTGECLFLGMDAELTSSEILVLQALRSSSGPRHVSLDDFSKKSHYNNINTITSMFSRIRSKLHSKLKEKHGVESTRIEEINIWIDNLGKKKSRPGASKSLDGAYFMGVSQQDIAIEP